MRAKIESISLQRWRSSMGDALRRIRAYRFNADGLRQRAKPGPEVWAFLGLIVVALGMRTWDLGGRTLHYDEILHAWYSWRFAEGFGYSHTPLTHGPFLFHGAAASFAVLGSSDVAARLLPALFGTALVGLPYFLRRELGRYGALATAENYAGSPNYWPITTPRRRSMSRPSPIGSERGNTLSSTPPIRKQSPICPNAYRCLRRCQSRAGMPSKSWGCA